MGQRASRSGGGCLRPKRNSKWIWKFHLKHSNMQNHRIPYNTATWGIVEDASEPAPFLSVVANRNGKWTRIFALFERRILQKAHKNQNHKILYNTATWDSVEVASERTPFQRIVTKRALWLRSGGNVYKNNVQIQWITKIKRTLRQDKICSPPGCCSFSETWR